MSASEVREQQLAEATARLGRAQRLLEPLEVVGPLEHALRSLLDPGQLLRDLRRRLARVALRGEEAAVEAFESPVDLRIEVAQPPVEPRLELAERAVETAERPADVTAERAGESESADSERHGEGENEDESQNDHRADER